MAATLSIAFTATPLGASEKLQVEATRMLSAGVTYINPTWYKQILVSAAAQASPQAVLTEYVAKFGSLVAGMKIGFRLTVINANGQRSAPLEVQKTIS